MKRNTFSLIAFIVCAVVFAGIMYNKAQKTTDTAKTQETDSQVTQSDDAAKMVQQANQTKTGMSPSITAPPADQKTAAAKQSDAKRPTAGSASRQVTPPVNYQSPKNNVVTIKKGELDKKEFLQRRFAALKEAPSFKPYEPPDAPVAVTDAKGNVTEQVVYAPESRYGVFRTPTLNSSSASAVDSTEAPSQDQSSDSQPEPTADNNTNKKKEFGPDIYLLPGDSQFRWEVIHVSAAKFEVRMINIGENEFRVDPSLIFLRDDRGKTHYYRQSYSLRASIQPGTEIIGSIAYDIASKPKSLFLRSPQLGEHTYELVK